MHQSCALLDCPSQSGVVSGCFWPSLLWITLLVNYTPLWKQSSPHVACFGLHLPPADALQRVWQGSSCSPPTSPHPPLSLPSITPDCIWQMPLLAPYHQVQWRQRKTILLCPYTTSVLHFAWLTHLHLQASSRAKALTEKLQHLLIFYWQLEFLGVLSLLIYSI